MTGRQLDVPPASSELASGNGGRVRLISPPNWTAVIFLLCLAFLHLSIAIPAFLKLRWEGYMSATLGCAFITAAIIVYCSRCEIVFDQQRRGIRIRNGLNAQFCFQRWISFDDVHAVRLTFSRSDRPRSRVE